MRIVLISIISSPKYGNTGIDFISAFLRKNLSDTVEVRYYHSNEDAEAIMNDLPKNFNVYGFSVFETNYVLSKKLAERIKTANSKAIIVFGGQFASMNYAEIINDCPHADYVVLGDGEDPMKRLVEHHRKSSEILTGDRNIASLHDMAGKTYNIEHDVDRYSCFDYFAGDTMKNNMDKTHCIMTKSNICTGHCSFCCSRKGRSIYKSVGRLADEIAYLSETYGVRKFFITDDDIFDINNTENRKRLHSFFDTIISLRMNLVFSGFAKPKTVCNPENRPLIAKMSRAGFSHIFLGIDAGSDFDRSLYEKNSTRNECVNALNILREEGISPRYGMIFFNPYSTLETMRETYRFLVELKSSNYYHYGGLRVQLLNGTRLLKRTEDDGLLSDDYSFMNTEGYNFVHTEVKEIADFLKFEFIPEADRIRNQYNTLSRLYSTVRHVNTEAERYRELTERYGNIEFEALREYFYHLYEENDIAYCKRQLSGFIGMMKRNADIYAEAITELRHIFSQTPIRRAEEKCFF